MSDGQVHTKFLSIQNLLEHCKSANADAIVDMMTQEIEKDNLQLTSLAGLASDGASMFTGRKHRHTRCARVLFFLRLKSTWRLQYSVDRALNRYHKDNLFMYTGPGFQSMSL